MATGRVLRILVRMRLLSFSLLFVTALGGLSGCSNSGALGQATLGQGCPSSRPSCAVSGLDAPVASGADVTLSVDLSLNGGGAPPLAFVSADEDVFTVSGPTLHGVGPGVASLLITAEEGVVLDFTAVWVQLPTALFIQRRNEDDLFVGEIPGTLQLLAGDRVGLSVSARSNSQPLAGTLPVTWSADPAVVTILEDGAPGQARLVARGPGKTKVTASALGLEQSFAVEVLP